MFVKISKTIQHVKSQCDVWQFNHLCANTTPTKDSDTQRKKHGE